MKRSFNFCGWLVLCDDDPDAAAGGGGAAVVPPADDSDNGEFGADDGDLVEKFSAMLEPGSTPAKKSAPSEPAGEGHPSGEDGGGSSFTDDLRSRAQLFGLNDADIESHASEDELERTLLILSRHRGAAGQTPEGQTPPPEGAPGTAGTPPAEPPVVGTLAEVFTPEELEDLGPQFKSFVERADSLIAAQAAKIEELSAVKEHFAQQHTQQVIGAFDRSVDKLASDGFAEIYGDSSKGKLTDAQLKSREKLFHSLQELDGVAALQNEAALGQFMRTLNAEHWEKMLTQRLSQRVKNNGKRRFAPSGSSSNPKAAPATTEDGEDSDLVALGKAMLAQQ